MDNFDDKNPIPAGSNDLQEQFDALRHLVVSILILLIVVSGTLSIYMLRQWRTVNKELTAFRPQATAMIADYQKNSVPVMSDFLKKLSEYGRIHADFAPTLAKYNIKPAAAPEASANPASSAPKAAPAKK
jgi:hypothetical protein